MRWTALMLAACAPQGDSGKPVETEETGAADSATEPHDSADGDTARADSGRETGDPGESGDTAPVDTGVRAWRSALYPEGWTPAFTDSEGRFLHDFSYAGYKAGEAPLPTVVGTSFDVTSYGADPTGVADSTDAIQAAIDAAEDAAAAGQAVVDFPAGTFRVEGTLTVQASNVVVRGAGVGVTYLYFTQTTGLDYGAHLTFRGSVTQGADHPLAMDGVARSQEVTLSDASGIQVGDQVALGFTITDAFVEAHGMTGVWYEFNGEWRTFFRRTVTGVDPTTGVVTVDVPLRYPLLLRDGASLRVESGYVTEVGIEGMSMSNAGDWETAWTTNQVHLVSFIDVRDAWARDLATWESPEPSDGRGMHLVSSGVEVVDSRRVTLSNITMENAAHRGGGGNGYLFEISRSNEVLTVDSVGRAGRHNFIQNWDFSTSGCVWLRTTSEEGRSLLGDWDPVGYPSYSEFHHSLAMANLIDDSVATDGWQGVNRQDESTGAGHSATENVWWNLRGGGYLRSLQYGHGYVIGTDAMDIHVDPDEAAWNYPGEGTEPVDWTEGVDEATTLEPQSLYEDQLLRRLGG